MKRLRGYKVRTGTYHLLIGSGYMISGEEEAQVDGLILFLILRLTLLVMM